MDIVRHISHLGRRRSKPDVRKACDQAQCTFFTRLPLEIRIQIYQELLSVLHFGDKRDIIFNNGHLASVICVSDPSSMWWGYGVVPHVFRDMSFGTDRQVLPICTGYAGDWRKNHAWCYYVSLRGETVLKSPNSYVCLLTSCRRIYQEAGDLLYSVTTFSFIGARAAYEFLSVLPPQWLNRIKALHIQWIHRWRDYTTSFDGRHFVQDDDLRSFEAKWKDLWQVVSTMSRLKEVKLTIRDFQFASLEFFLPSSLWGVRVEKFIVEVDWMGDLNIPSAPFEVRRVALENDKRSTRRRRLI